MSAGIIISKKTGDNIKAGDTLATLYTSTENTLDSAEEKFLSALSFCENPPEISPLIYEVLK